MDECATLETAAILQAHYAAGRLPLSAAPGATSINTTASPCYLPEPSLGRALVHCGAIPPRGREGPRWISELRAQVSHYADLQGRGVTGCAGAASVLLEAPLKTFGVAGSLVHQLRYLADAWGRGHGVWTSEGEPPAAAASQSGRRGTRFGGAQEGFPWAAADHTLPCGRLYGCFLHELDGGCNGTRRRRRARDASSLAPFGSMPYAQRWGAFWHEAALVDSLWRPTEPLAAKLCAATQVAPPLAPAVPHR